MRLLLPFLILGFLNNAVASETTEPVGASVVEAASKTRDRFYDVRGTSADAVFHSIGRRNLGNTPGRSASGLTESKLSYSLESIYGGDKPCRIVSLRLSMDIVVTLPRHAAPSSLDTDARRNWEIYATAVEEHEYRHVEIELRGLQELTERLRRSIADGKITASGKAACSNYVDELLAQQRALTRERHEEFHRDSAREVRELQHAARDRLEDFDAETRSQQKDVEDFDELIRIVRAEHENRIATWDQLPSNQRTDAKLEMEAVITELNAAIEQRNRLVEQLIQRSSDRNGLVEDLLWIR